MKLQLSILEPSFAIHRFPPDHKIPDQVYGSGFYTISKTVEELSIICSSAIRIESETSEADWSCIKVDGPLDFSLTGILAGIATVLAESEISIFALSTFDTDYILVKSDQLTFARNALLASGYTFTH